MLDARSLAILIVLLFSGSALLLSWGYFRRYALKRPPIGVLNLTDILFLLIGIVLFPYLYLLLPLWLVGTLFMLQAFGLLYYTSEPLLGAGRALGLATLLLGGDLGVADQFGATSNILFAVNNVVLLLSIVGITNLWAQSGLRARDLTILATFLTGYDFTATVALPLMGDLMTRLVGLPGAPILGWAMGGSTWIGIGMGDLLLGAVFPLVLRKAFGRAAGLAALAITATAIIGIFLLSGSGIFPVMVILGPLMLVQYGFWYRRQGSERTHNEYLLADGKSVSAPSLRQH